MTELETRARALAVVSLAAVEMDRQYPRLPPLRATAFHEAAHAVVAHWFGEAVKPVVSVSIISDGTTSGRVLYAPAEASTESSEGRRVRPLADRRRAVVILSLAFGNWRRVRSEMRAARKRANELIDLLAPEIDRVATALLHSGELTGDEFAGLINSNRRN